MSDPQDSPEGSIVSKDEPLLRWPEGRPKPDKPRHAGQPLAAPAVEDGPPPGPHPFILLAGAAWTGARKASRSLRGALPDLGRLALVQRLLGLLLILLGLVHLWPPAAALAYRMEMLDDLAGALRVLGLQAATLDIGPELAAGPPWWWIAALIAPFLHFAAARSAAAGKPHDVAFVMAVALGCIAFAWFIFGNETLRPPVLAAETRKALVMLVLAEAVLVLGLWLFTKSPPQTVTDDD